ncbi:MFS transporter [Actinomadura madurae]|nr:MFS transporter [Actinomadura madurae]
MRVGLQFALLLPVGTVTDAIGARRTGAIACAVRAAGFALLGAADGVGALLCAAVVLAVGGALYNPAAQSLLAGVDPARRSGGFAAYVATQHIATVAGPPMGLALVTLGPGFAALAGTAAALWAIAGGLFLLLPRSGGRPGPARFGAIAAGARAALGDRSFLLFALMTAPTTLLANHIMTAVPLLGFTSGAATLCFCVLAAVAAALQPLVAAGRRGERPWVLRLGLLCAAAAFCVLAPLDGTQTGPLMLAAVLNGVANGLIQPGDLPARRPARAVRALRLVLRRPGVLRRHVRVRGGPGDRTAVRPRPGGRGRGAARGRRLRARRRDRHPWPMSRGVE